VKIEVEKKEFEIEDKIQTILEALIYIKENIEPNLAFRYHCKSGVCGSCSIRVNGIEKLSCVTKINSGDKIAPLNYHTKLKDLVVSSKTTLLKNLNLENKLDLESESECILCESCYSSCPVIVINSEFIGPFSLVRFYLYNNKSNLEKVQKNGIWDCTLCGNCNMVCPAGIDIKGDILKLQSISIQNGYVNPNLANFDNFNFGFNPNF